jgi:hypothetical protein
MAGAGTRLFEAGSILTANQINTYLMDQVVARFATIGARDSAFGSAGQPELAEGRLCYLDSTNKVYIYTGSGWEEIGSQIEAGEVGTTELADSSVTTAKIANGTILNEDISSSASIALSKLATGALPTAITIASANIVDGTIVNDDISSSASIALSKLATGALPSGITVSSTNITDLTIADADISSSASIALSKLATGSLPTSITVASANIVDGTIVDGDISSSASIALSKLALGALPTSITVASANIVNGTIVNEDVSASAAIAYSKLSLGTSIVNADISASAGIVDTKLATISSSGKVSNSATTATDANTASAIVARDASGNFIAGKATLATADINTVIETANIVASASTGTINIDFSTNPTVYYTSNATANWTLNVRGTSGVTLNNTLATGQIATVTFLATNGSTPYRPTVFQVDGSAVTPKWMGGTAPSAGNASSIDAYTLAIIKTGSATFTVLASQTKFA